MGSWRDRLREREQRIADERRRKEDEDRRRREAERQAEYNRQEARKQEDYQRRLQKYQKRYHCHICGKGGEPPTSGGHSGVKPGSPTTTVTSPRVVHWDKPPEWYGGLLECARCGKWTCDDCGVRTANGFICRNHA